MFGVLRHNDFVTEKSSPNEINSGRKSERIDARILVQLKSNADFFHAYSQNISKGGVLLESQTLPDPNAIVEVQFDLGSIFGAGGPSSLALTGKVVRLMSIIENGKPIHKVAIQFIDLDPRLQLQIDALYNRLTQS